MECDIVSYVIIIEMFISTFFPLPLNFPDYFPIFFSAITFFYYYLIFSQRSSSSRPMFVAFVFVHILHLLYDVQPFL